MEFEFKELQDVADVTKLAGFEFSKYMEYIDGGDIIALRALNIRNGDLDLSDVKLISNEISNQLSRSKLFVNDIVLTYTGNGYGDCAFINENDKYHLAPNIAKISPKDNINPHFLFQVIKSSMFRRQMKSFIVGSSQPTIPMKTIRILKIPFMDIKTQDRIVNILKKLDDKIKINKKINHNLKN